MAAVTEIETKSAERSWNVMSHPRVRDGAPTVEGVFRRVNQLKRHLNSRGLPSFPLVTRCSRQWASPVFLVRGLHLVARPEPF